MTIAIVKFEYPYFGDGSATIWLAHRLDEAFKNNDIMDYAEKTSIRKIGAFDIKYVQGRFIMYVNDDVTIADLQASAQNMANYIVGDKDAKIVKISLR